MLSHNKKLSTNIYFIASLFKQPLAFIYVLFIILQTYPTTLTGKANVKRA